MRGSDLILALGVAVGMIGPAASAFAEPPRRVVSMNLCTDQLAMLVAAPGQLLSVSRIARDPRVSAMVDLAQGFPINHGSAEEIYLLRPDLVLAGIYSSRAPVDMLTRLGVPVVSFDVVTTLDDIPDRITQMGAVLGQPARAATINAAYRTGLAALQTAVATRPRAALWSANGYTSGDKGLASQILATAGFANIAAEYGFAEGGFMPLEVLAMAAPDAVITSALYPGTSRAEEIMDHPAVAALRQTARSGQVTSKDWICGTPHVLRAITAMGALRRRIEDG